MSIGSILTKSSDKIIDTGIKVGVILLGYKLVKDNVLPALGIPLAPASDSTQNTLDNIASAAQNTSAVASDVTGAAAQLTGVLSQGVKNVADAGTMLMSPGTWTDFATSLASAVRYRPKSVGAPPLSQTSTSAPKSTVSLGEQRRKLFLNDTHAGRRPA